MAIPEQPIAMNALPSSSLTYNNTENYANAPSGSPLSPARNYSEQVDARSAMKAEVTRLLTATALCDPDFPNVLTLPRVAALPDSNLGHLVLLDYEKLSKNLWSVVQRIQRSVSVFRVRVAQVIACLAAILFYAVIVNSSGRVSDETHWAAVVLSSIVALGIYLIIGPRVRAVCAAARASALDRLFTGQDIPVERDFMMSVAWGDGEASSDQIPVLIADGKHTFPGFGRLQASQLFVCPPKNASDASPTNQDALFNGLFQAAVKEVKYAKLAHMHSGRVAVVHKDALHKKSAWLRHGRPLLFVTPEDVARITQSEPETPMRIYGMIQAVVPEHLGVISFFVRAFFAGTSASVEIDMCTLGPPLSSLQSVRKKLQEYREFRYPFFFRLIREWLDRKPPKTALGAQLRRLRKAYQAAAKSFRDI